MKPLKKIYKKKEDDPNFQLASFVFQGAYPDEVRLKAFNLYKQLDNLFLLRASCDGIASELSVDNEIRHIVSQISELLQLDLFSEQIEMPLENNVVKPAKTK